MTTTWPHTDTATGTNWTTTPTTNYKEHAKLLDVSVYYDDLRPGIDGLYIPNPPSIFIRPNQHPHYENWVGWHELSHYMTGTKHVTSVASRRAVENLCDRIAAENMLPIALLADRTLFSTDLAQWAYNLNVPPYALTTRLRHLTIRERRALALPRTKTYPDV